MTSEENRHLTILPTEEVYACRRVQNSRVGNAFMEGWGVPDTMEAKAFVTLGYHAGGLSEGQAPHGVPEYCD